MVTSAGARPEVVSLSVSDHLDAVCRAGGDGAPVQGAGAVGPGLQVPVLGGANQEHRLPRARPVLGNAVAKETVCVIPPNFYDGNSCLQIERVRCSERGHEDQGCGEAAGGHVEAGDPRCQGPLVTIISCPCLMSVSHDVTAHVTRWLVTRALSTLKMSHCPGRTGHCTVQGVTQYTVHPVAALHLLSTEVSDAARPVFTMKQPGQDNQVSSMQRTSFI